MIRISTRVTGAHTLIACVPSMSPGALPIALEPELAARTLAIRAIVTLLKLARCASEATEVLLACRNTRAVCNFTSWNLVHLVVLLHSARLASECTLASIRASRVWKAASGVDPRSLRALASVDGLVPRRERQVLGLLAVVARRSQHHARRRAALAPHHAQHREH